MPSSRNSRPSWSTVALAVCSLPAWAQTAPAAQDENSLPPVVVTGEKTQRSLTGTSSSVRVITSREIGENPGLMSTDGLLGNIANVTASGVQNLAPAVRGVDGTGPAQGADAFLAGTRPRLNIVVDGRTASYNEVTFGELGLWDVNQVEVFRGTQSLLQGRNSIAGTVVYKTNDPTFEPEFGARVLFGNHRQREYAAVLSTPLDDEWALRIALDHQGSQSFASGYQPYEGVSDPGAFESNMARAKLLYRSKAVPGLRSLWTLSHADHRGPQTESVARPFENKASSYPAMPVFAPHVTSAVWDLDWKLSEAVTFENRIVYGDLYIRRKAVPADGNATIRGRDFAVEPRLRLASADQTLNGFVGLYAFDAKQRDDIDLFGGGAWDDKTQTYAVYGEGTWTVQPDLDLTFGSRYEREHRYRKGSLAFFLTDFDETYDTFLPKLSVAWRTSPHTTVGAAISRGYNGGGAAFTYDEPYTNYTFEPEYVWNYEAFVRSNLLDDRLRLTANVFHSRYRNMQVPFDQNGDPAVWSYIVLNAPRASTYGAELGMTWLPQAGLKLAAELGLLHTNIDEYPGSGVEGHELPRAPAATLNLDVQWRTPVGLQLGASARYSTAYYSEVTNVPRGRVEPGWIANLRAAYPIGSAKVFAYVNNVLDSDRPILVSADANGQASNDTASLPRPRSVGVGVEAWF